MPYTDPTIIRFMVCTVFKKTRETAKKSHARDCFNESKKQKGFILK